jgi:glucose/arabinose dehydrogenase
MKFRNAYLSPRGLRHVRYRSIAMWCVVVGLTLCIFGRAEEAKAQNGTLPPPRPLLTTVAEDLDQPLSITHAGDGSDRLFVVERPGRIRIVDASGVRTTPFLDLTARVTTNSECGLLGLAFAPDYATSGDFYVYYSYDVVRLGDLVPPDVPNEPNGGCDSVLARFSVSADDPNLADVASETRILVINQPYNNHNGGDLAFSPLDGYLYVSLGDGGSGGDPHNLAQNPASLLGKLLRIDVSGQETYIVPADNPLVGVDGARGEIWALGLRNPWRFSFDRADGALFSGDVGQSFVEEVNRQPGESSGGENYGWRVLEGDQCYSPASGCDPTSFTAPIFTYRHTEFGCAVTGGYVYRGTRYPDFAGSYLYGDFCDRRLRALTIGESGWSSQIVLDTPFSVLGFGEDEAGELYVGATTGSVYRLGFVQRELYLPLIQR